MESMQHLTLDLLNRLNRPLKEDDIIARALSLIRKHARISAVGIRLKDGEDYPFLETAGFPEPFLNTDTMICARDQTGEIIRDTEGRPVLEGICGAVISGRTNPDLPCFSENGSFWTNSSTELFAGNALAELKLIGSERCHPEGYESTALIPLKAGADTIGLLQLHDPKKDIFSPEMIRTLEEAAAAIGLALIQMEGGKKLRGIIDMSGKICHEMNQPLMAISGYAELLMMELSEEDPLYNRLSTIVEQIHRLKNTTRRLMNVIREESR